jgi:hypothetical protein
VVEALTVERAGELFAGLLPAPGPVRAVSRFAAGSVTGASRIEFALELYNWFTISGQPAALPAIHRELRERLGEAAAERTGSPVVARDRRS